MLWQHTEKDAPNFLDEYYNIKSVRDEFNIPIWMGNMEFTSNTIKRSKSCGLRNGQILEMKKNGDTCIG